TPQLVGALAWSVLVLTGGGISLLFLMLRRGAAAQVTSYFYLVPGLTALMAFAMFGEALGPVAIAGMGLTVLGVALATRRAEQRAARGEPRRRRPHGLRAAGGQRGRALRQPGLGRARHHEARRAEGLRLGTAVQQGRHRAVRREDPAVGRDPRDPRRRPPREGGRARREPRRVLHDPALRRLPGGARPAGGGRRGGAAG